MWCPNLAVVSALSTLRSNATEDGCADPFEPPQPSPCFGTASRLDATLRHYRQRQPVAFSRTCAILGRIKSNLNYE